MSVYWTRAHHPELGDVVLPLAAMESFPDWEAVGEPSTDDGALRAELEREQAAAAIAALIAESASANAAPSPAPEASASPAKPESPTPTGADPKEQ